MSIRFSRVMLVSHEKTAIFLVGGSPRGQYNLEGWTAFKAFKEGLQPGETFAAHVESFLYGGEEPVDATPEEVAYIYKRMEMRPDFIEARTEKCDEYDLAISLCQPAI